MNNARLRALNERESRMAGSYGNEYYRRYRGGDAGRIEDELTLADVVPVKPPSARNAGNYHAGGKGFTGSFYGGITAENLGAKMASYVPGPAARRIYDALSDDLDLRKPQRRPRTRMNRDEGDGVGDPFEYSLWRRGATRDQNWWERTEEITKRKHGEIVMHCDIGITCGEDETALEMSGAAAMAVTDLLEEMGYRVTMYATISIYHDKWLDLRIAVKSADERLSPNAMALICKGGISRVVQMTHYDSRDDIKVDGSYGQPKNYHGRHEPDIQVPKFIRDERSAFEWVREVMKAINEEDEE